MKLRSGRGTTFVGCSAALNVSGSSPDRPLLVGVAQWVERVTVTPQRLARGADVVTGSIPVPGKISSGSSVVERAPSSGGVRTEVQILPAALTRGSSKKAYTRSVMNVGCRCRVSGAQLDSCAWTQVRPLPTGLRGGSSTVERWSIGIPLEGHQIRDCAVRLPPAASAEVAQLGERAKMAPCTQVRILPSALAGIAQWRSAAV